MTQTSIISARSRRAWRRAFYALRRGASIVFPTDTVYGIGCDAFNLRALRHLAVLKGRPQNKPFPLLASDLAMVNRVAVVPAWLEPLPKILWPGPWTFVLPVRPGPARHKFSKFISRRNTVAVRIPAHVGLRRLIAKLGRPIVGTSANRAGKKPVRSARAAFQKFAQRKDHPDLILDGGTLRGRASVVIDATGRNPRILRK